MFEYACMQTHSLQKKRFRLNKMQSGVTAHNMYTQRSLHLYLASRILYKCKLKTALNPIYSHLTFWCCTVCCCMTFYFIMESEFLFHDTISFASGIFSANSETSRLHAHIISFKKRFIYTQNTFLKTTFMVTSKTGTCCTERFL